MLDYKRNRLDYGEMLIPPQGYRLTYSASPLSWNVRGRRSASLSRTGTSKPKDLSNTASSESSRSIPSVVIVPNCRPSSARWRSTGLRSASHGSRN